MLLRLPWPVDLGSSADTDEAREVDADFFPPENKLQLSYELETTMEQQLFANALIIYMIS